MGTAGAALTPGGPRVVALGGGHGLAATLTAVRSYASQVTAVVSVADDGGSSGRLRQAFGIPAPGDLRRCLVALGDPTSPWTGFFEHRFDAGELEGHALGNLVIAGLASATGDFAAALEEAGRLVGCAGRVLPASTVPVVLKADADGGPVEGQVNVSSAGRISAVSLVPPDAPAPPAALKAIATADQVVLGPGSLFTSVLAAAIVPEVTEALAATSAQTVYVCNLRPQLPETDDFDVGRPRACPGRPRRASRRGAVPPRRVGSGRLRRGGGRAAGGRRSRVWSRPRPVGGGAGGPGSDGLAGHNRTGGVGARTTTVRLEGERLGARSANRGRTTPA